MVSYDIEIGFFFLFQTGLGILGNSFFLGLYIVTLFTGLRMRPIDLFLTYLAFVNDLVLLLKGIPQTMAAFGLTSFLNDVGCKLVFYFHKVARDLSLCTTCLLSGFQAITLSPKSFWWSKFKANAPKYSIPFYFICWTFHLLTNHKILLLVNGPKGSDNISKRKKFIYCDSIASVSLDTAVYAFIICLPDVLWIGFMVGTSAYMVYVLYRHRQRVQYVHGNRLTPCGSPETRATQTILLLVILFVSFYSLNSILALYVHYGKSSSWLVHISAFLSACFPACSSFVLIVSDSQVRKYYLALWDTT